MNKGVPQSREDLERCLDEQIRFMMLSADSFDSGFDGEAKRLAVSIRVLLHDTRHSHALLSQLGRIGGATHFISTAIPLASSARGSHGGIVMMLMHGDSVRYVAGLDNVAFHQWLPFDLWWDEVIFRDTSCNEMSRKQLILSMADQDGGAHVDPLLDETYAKLSRENSMGWCTTVNGDAQPIPNVERAAVRQIAHEVLRTLCPDYRKELSADEGVLIFAPTLVEGHKPPQLPRARKIGRNELCPCGSGVKYKKCHGHAGLEM